jgi:hypothetical protein
LVYIRSSRARIQNVAGLPLEPLEKEIVEVIGIVSIPEAETVEAVFRAEEMGTTFAKTHSLAVPLEGT